MSCLSPQVQIPLAYRTIQEIQALSSRHIVHRPSPRRICVNAANTRLRLPQIMSSMNANGLKASFTTLGGTWKRLRVDNLQKYCEATFSLFLSCPLSAHFFGDRFLLFVESVHHVARAIEGKKGFWGIPPFNTHRSFRRVKSFWRVRPPRDTHTLKSFNDEQIGEGNLQSTSFI